MICNNENLTFNIRTKFCKNLIESLLTCLNLVCNNTICNECHKTTNTEFELFYFRKKSVKIAYFLLSQILSDIILIS